MPELSFYYCNKHANGGMSFRKCPVCEDDNNAFILDAVKGEPNSLTSTAYHTGEIMERERIIKLILKQAAEWTRPVSHNPVRMLQALAETIRTGDTNG
jgi:hypothetical protein